MEMNVILDIFSGRPNPRWELSHEQTSQFLKKIMKLKNKENFHAESSKTELGYRGFIVEEENFAQKGRRFYVYNGIVNVSENNSSYALDDKEYSIERWLLETSPNYLGEIIEYVKQEIEKKIVKS
jgi:hypothetical protein